MPQDKHNETPDFDEAQSTLMDALLQRTFEASSEETRKDSLGTTNLEADADRVEQLMATIRSKTSPSAAQLPNPSDSQRWRRWLSLPLAAALLLALSFFILPGGSSRSALAAIDQSLLAESKPLVRQYLITIESTSDAKATKTRTHELFVRKRDFVIRTSPLFGSGEVWVGGIGPQRWIVPRIGPVLIGSEGLLKQENAYKKVIETPFMSVESILERTRDHYDLNMTSSVPLPGGEPSILCHHIQGQRKASERTSLPQSVDVWIDPQSGFAQHIHLKWEADANSRWREATAQLLDTPDLNVEFFDHAAHHSAERHVVELN